MKFATNVLALMSKLHLSSVFNLDVKPDNVIIVNPNTCEVLLGDVETFVRYPGELPKGHGTFCYHHPLFWNGDLSKITYSNANGYNIDAAAVAHTMYYIVFLEECVNEVKHGADLNHLFSDSRVSERFIYTILELTA